MEKEPCTKFCGVLISSHKVMKLQSFKSGVNDRDTSEWIKHFVPGFICISLLIL